MGTSGQKCDVSLPDISSSAILISFLKIKELESIYSKKKKGELSNILFSLNERIQNEYNIDSIIKKFTKMKGKTINETDEIIDFIIKQLNKELIESIENEEEDEIEEIKKQLFKSLIKDLFFGQREYDLECKKCKYRIHIEEEFTNTFIDLSSKNEEEIDINKFYKEDKVDFTKKIICPNNKCKNVFEYSQKINYCNYFIDIKELPDIFIMHFKHREMSKIKGDIDAIMKLQIKKDNYNLICFIAKVDENNESDKKYNVFYLRNSIWHVYKVDDMLNKITTDSINAIPLVAFYQRDKTLFQDYYQNVISLLDDKENTFELLDEHILNDGIYHRYYIVNKKWYDDILKIYEEEENYENSEYEINHKKLTKISKLNYIEMIVKCKMFFKRKNDLFEDTKDIYQLKTETKNNIQYPNNFMLIKENIFNYLLYNLNIDKKKYQENLFEMKFGEKYAFIIDKDKSSNSDNFPITIFVSNYSTENRSFKVVVILKLNSINAFNHEIENFISNKGGLEYYYNERGFKKENKEEQAIKDKEDFKIGTLINIENWETHLNEVKLKKDNSENNVNNENNNNMNMIMNKNMNVNMIGNMYGNQNNHINEY